MEEYFETIEEEDEKAIVGSHASSIKRKLPKDVQKTSKKKEGLTSEVLKDERFIAIFENKDFEVDEISNEYLALHPMHQQQKQASFLEEYFETIEEEDEKTIVGSHASSGADDADVQKKSKKKKGLTIEVLKDERFTAIFENKRKLPKVNRALAARLLQEEEELNQNKGGDDADVQKTSNKKKGLMSDVLKDERFRAMFENKITRKLPKCNLAQAARLLEEEE
ncbi:nucleolar protein 10-like [Sesamum indicum]|uniref:Nucleolar protein 10-like n=1 Tax=Sesamum indicum TaxID=4182 RepID=A0A6I9V2I5_SESIN|nr:nucleolar protein 10-like [Sesamum indicum]